jgi:hypothetical protein
MRTDNAADIRLVATLENSIFYISRMYEFSHSLDPERTSAIPAQRSSEIIRVVWEIAGEL